MYFCVSITKISFSDIIESVRPIQGTKNSVTVQKVIQSVILLILYLFKCLNLVKKVILHLDICHDDQTALL